MSDKKELPVGCEHCQTTLPCEETCGADPFFERGQSHQAAEVSPSNSSGWLDCKASFEHGFLCLRTETGQLLWSRHQCQLNEHAGVPLGELIDEIKSKLAENKKAI